MAVTGNVTEATPYFLDVATQVIFLRPKARHVNAVRH
jgi:hypothetical protein